MHHCSLRCFPSVICNLKVQSRDPNSVMNYMTIEIVRSKVPSSATYIMYRSLCKAGYYYENHNCIYAIRMGFCTYWDPWVVSVHGRCLHISWYQLVFPTAQTPPLVLRQSVSLGSTDQGLQPPHSISQGVSFSRASLCSLQWLRYQIMQLAGDVALIKLSIFLNSCSINKKNIALFIPPPKKIVILSCQKSHIVFAVYNDIFLSLCQYYFFGTVT